MEHPRSLKKTLSLRRVRSLDRSQNPMKDSGSRCFQSLSLPASPSRQVLTWMASDGGRCPESPVRSVETQGTPGTALIPEETRESLSSEQRPPQDTKKDKAQRRAQQGWLKSVLNFFLRAGAEETKEKASRKPKGKEGLPEPADTPEPQAPGKKAHDKKPSRKKHSHKKHGDEETKGTQDQGAEGREAVLPGMAARLRSHETDLGPAPRGGEDSDLHQSLLIGDGAGAASSELPSQATGHPQEEELKKLDKDTIIRMIVQLLQKVGDQWEEEQFQASQPKVAPQNPAAALRRKSQEKKPNLRRALSHKKHAPEEPKRAGAADVSSPDSRPSKRPSYLSLCVGGHRPSISSSLGSEEPEVQEAITTDCGDPSPLELFPQAGSPGPEADRASEFKEFIRMIVALIQDAEEREGEHIHVQEPEVAVENLASPRRKKSPEKKCSLRKAFSHKKHGSKEPKRAGAAGPDPRPRRPSYLPLCVGGGHRPSSSSSLDPEECESQESLPADSGPVGSSDASLQARGRTPEGRPLPDGACESKELIIQKLVVLLQGVDSHLGEQIKRHPSYKRFFYQLPDSSLRKLTAALRRQGAHSTEPDGNLAKRPYQFPFGLANKLAGNNYHAVLSLMGLHNSQHSYPQFPCREAQQSIASPESQSPD